MNTKVLMTLSAVIMGVAGIILSFLSQEISDYLSLAVANLVIMQILGSLYFGFAMLNCTTKANLIERIPRSLLRGGCLYYV